ncbi:O-methyltransferase [Cytophaga hutchinsonii ATCC 33406]|nr:O-methyltransferase [Cytophaga hutchinsonii ATCC 33406]
MQTKETRSSMRFYQEEKHSAVDAKFEAQKIAFAPFVFQASMALRDLGILKIIEDSGTAGITQEEIVAKLTLSNYGVRVLVEAGLGMGLLIINDGKYTITRVGYYILNDPMTIANMDFVQDINYQGFFHLKDSIVNGKPEGLKVIGPQYETFYQALSELPEKEKQSWLAFDHFYSDDSFSRVLPIVFKFNPAKILDVGGNTGKWSLSCVHHNKDVKMTIADLPQQIAMAKENISQYKEGERISYHPLDILKPETSLPAGYDVVWMSQFLDCFSEDEIVGILKKALTALTDSGKLIIMETFWDRQKFEAASFCLQQTSLYFTCIANGNSQMYHSEVFIRCVEKAGFVIEEDINNVGISHTVLICKKK